MLKVMAAQPNIGGALCWMLLIKLRKSRSGAICDDKTARRSQKLGYKADVNETCSCG